MTSKKFMFLYRNPISSEQGPQPSPEEMQESLAAWYQWKEKHPAIVDMGDGLLPTGRFIKGGVVTDGPSAESKELVSGYSIVAVADYDTAVTIARECLILNLPGATIEVRELAGY